MSPIALWNRKRAIKIKVAITLLYWRRMRKVTIILSNLYQGLSPKASIISLEQIEQNSRSIMKDLSFRRLVLVARFLVIFVPDVLMMLKRLSSGIIIYSAMIFISRCNVIKLLYLVLIMKHTVNSR